MKCLQHVLNKKSINMTHTLALNTFHKPLAVADVTDDIPLPGNTRHEVTNLHQAAHCITTLTVVIFKKIVKCNAKVKIICTFAG